MLFPTTNKDGVPIVDIMVDIETLGTQPGSMIVAIGAVEFDIHAAHYGDLVKRRFYRQIDPRGAADRGLTQDPGTWLWWMDQSKEAQQASLKGTHALGAVLSEFRHWAYETNGKFVRFWGNSPSFDQVLLEAAFKRSGLPFQAPWHYREWRDCRTLFETAELDFRKLLATWHHPVGDNEVMVPHHPLHDAWTQAWGVVSAVATLLKAMTPAPNDYLSSVQFVSAPDSSLVFNPATPLPDTVFMPADRLAPLSATARPRPSADLTTPLPETARSTVEGLKIPDWVPLNDVV